MVQLNPLAYLTSGRLQQDIEWIKTRIKKDEQIMTVDVDQILANTKAISDAIVAVGAIQGQALADLQAQIADLKSQGVDTAKLQQIADAQADAIAAIQKLGTAAAGADPGPITGSGTMPNAPGQVPPPEQAPTSATTESDDTAVGTVTSTSPDGTHVVRDADGNIVSVTEPTNVTNNQLDYRKTNKLK